MSISETKSGQIEVRREVRRRVASAEEAERLERLLSEGLVEALRRFDAGEEPCVTIASGLEAFLAYQRAQEGNALSTLAAYRRRLAMFAQRWGDVPLTAITRQMVEDWKTDRLGATGKRRRYHRDRRVSRDTVNNDLKALQKFARWAIDMERARPGLPLLAAQHLSVKGKVRGNRFVPKALTRGELRRRERAFERAGKGHLAVVMRAMALLMLREEALFVITMRDVSLPTRKEAGRIDVAGVKGGPDGGIPFGVGSEIHRLVRRCVALWQTLHGRRPRKDEPLFCTARGKSKRAGRGWRVDTFCHEFRRVADRLGFDDFTPYQVRHSIITWLQQQPGVSLASIQAAARHMRITTQEVYSHRSGRDGLSAYAAAERFFGRDADALCEGDEEEDAWGDALAGGVYPADVGEDGGFARLQAFDGDGC